MASKTESKESKAKKTTPEPQKEEKILVKIPRANRGDEPFFTASINGKVYRIKKGETVAISPALKEVLDHAEEQDIAADEYIEKLQSELADKAKNI